MTLMTIGNHMYFDEVRPGDRKFYASPSRLFEYYCNSVYVTDQALKILFDRIKKDPLYDDSVFIITGDHPFPLGEHGLVSNEAAFYEEFYKVPFLIVGKGIRPERISGCAYSHLDLAPTIADLAGCSVKRTHWTGVSILRPEKRKHFLFLVQPYSGRFLTVIDYPYKYTKHLRTGDEYLFDLQEDPAEMNNLVGDGRFSKEKDTLRGALKTVFLNQRLLEEDRIWDGS